MSWWISVCRVFSKTFFDNNPNPPVTADINEQISPQFDIQDPLIIARPFLDFLRWHVLILDSQHSG